MDVVIDRSGKHRSVAVAELAWAALQKMPGGVACPLVQHLCSYYWRLTRCQKQARQSGRPCPQCGDVVTDQAPTGGCVLACVPTLWLMCMRTCVRTYVHTSVWTYVQTRLQFL